MRLRKIGSIDAYPILTFLSTPIGTPSITKGQVIQFAIKSLPVPDDSVSWEQIIEYRSDPDSQSKFLALRKWMSEVARAKLTPIEIEEKLEYLIDQYQRHLRLHQLKTNAGLLETVVVSSAEFLEDLVKFRWSKIAKGLFSLKHRRISLMEGELTAPGNEIAYIVKTREKFSS